MRVPYIDPSFEAYVKLQLKFGEAFYGDFLSVQDSFQKEHKGSPDDILQEMRQLTICGNY